MIRVLIVDDSLTIREYLKEIFLMDGDFQIVGEAKDGFEAIEKVKTTRPDVVTMDIQMPRMDGYEATRRIMETQPVPIVIVSAAWIPEEVETTFKAMKIGAVAGIKKPQGIGSQNFKDDVSELIKTVKLMSEVKVIRRRPKSGRTIETDQSKATTTGSKNIFTFKKPTYELLAIGASTGGPPVLQNIFEKLSPNLKVPIVVVQHITSGFLNGLVDWLNKSTPFPVHIASENQKLLPGNIYFAPDNVHMGVKRNKTIYLSNDPPEHSIRPSVSFLFRSISDAFSSKAIGLLLTGMGKDGAEELKKMRDRNAMTIAQDKKSSTVFGMPGEAVRLDAANYVLAPDDIISRLNYWIG
ncbi:response regulator receiver modulated CheB methylesterase [Candidatus Magnetomorum sp. HK-1]|nr:response regulator receiver modulated CheB methylesterase [Candidatus Magnetomorum sp. HK-1]